MKKTFSRLILFSILFFMLGTSAYAIGMDIGGKFGVGMGWWRGGDSYNKVAKDVMGAPDVTFGPYTSLEIHKHVSLQIELLFTYVGNVDKARTLGIEYSRKFRNFGFGVPLYVKPKFEVGPGELFFLVGPKFLILLDDFSISTKTLSSTVVHEIETNNGIGRQIHLGISCGIGYDWKVGPGKFQFAFNITPYLTNYGKNYNRAIQNEFTFDFGYAYTLKWYKLL